MDRKSIIGLLLIGGILIGWMYLSRPTPEQLAKQRAQYVADSTAQYSAEAKTKKDAANSAAKTSGGASTLALSDTSKMNDSVKSILKKQVYGDFADASSGENKIITIENEVMKVNISSKGGRVASVELKKYKTFDQKPLLLFDADSSTQNISFKAYSKDFATDSLYFIPDGNSFSISGKDSKSISMRLYAGNKTKYIEYVYTLKGDDYMMGFRLNTVGMQNIITNNMTLNWGMKTPSQEQNHQTQQRASTIYFKSPTENVDKISEASFEKKTPEFPLKWVGFKQQFFTSVIVANDFVFDHSSTLETATEQGSPKYVKQFTAALSIPFTHKNTPETFGMSFYFGPNHYKTLKKYDLELEKQINLGWKIFGWLNRFLVIPVFNILDSFHLNYGIIILLLTIILKLLLLPIAYKTVLSSAKMRVLKPEIDEINEKYKNDDAVKKQQATMALYKTAGVNPMAGCIPVL
ncbi:MAG: membrane protein insertase YidC, partial [Bacteroidia bacterium]